MVNLLNNTLKKHLPKKMYSNMLKPEEIETLNNKRVELWANIQSGFYWGKVYLVGSSLYSKTPRDLDIACVISDKMFCDRYNLTAFGGSYSQSVIKWAEGYKSGEYTDSHWAWCKDVIHKAEQGARYIGDGMLDYKVIAESHDKQDYSDKPKLRIDTNPYLK